MSHYVFGRANCRDAVTTIELVAVELKVGEFKAGYKGYLTTLPPRAVLIDRLEQATRRAQLQVAQHASEDDRP